MADGGWEGRYPGGGVYAGGGGMAPSAGSDAAVLDPALPAAALARVAHDRPEWRAAVAGHPAAYPGLLNWLDALGDPAVSAAVAVRRAREAAATPPRPPYQSALPPPVPVPPVQPSQLVPAASPQAGWTPQFAPMAPTAPVAAATPPGGGGRLAWGAILVVLAGIFAGGLLVGTSDSLFFFVVYVVIDNYVPGTESVRQILTAFIGAVSYAVAIGCAWLVVKGRVARRAAAPWFIAVVAAGFIFGLPHLSDIVSSGPSLVDLEPYYYGYNSLTLGYWLAQSLLAATACAGWFRLRGRPNKAFAVLPVALATAFLGQLIVSGMRASSLFYEILSALPGTLGYYTIYGLVTGLTLGLCYLITVVPVAALGAVVAPTASATAGAVGPSGAAPGFGPQPGYQPSSQYETASPSDTGSFGWVVMGLFAPWVGLVLWLVWQRDRPRNSRQARNGFIVGMIVNTIVVILEIFYILFSVG